MRLWLLGRKEKPVYTYDEQVAVVVRAETEESARRLATEEAGDEGKAYWVDPTQSSCEELLADGEEGIIVSDFHEA